MTDARPRRPALAAQRPLPARPYGDLRVVRPARGAAKPAEAWEQRVLVHPEHGLASAAAPQEDIVILVDAPHPRTLQEQTRLCHG